MRNKRLSLTTILTGAGLAWSAGQAGAATLMHHWTFDTDGSDSVGSADTSFQGSAGVTTGSAGVFGEALNAPDASEGAVVSPPNAPVLPTSNFSYTAWVKIDPTSPDGNLTVMGNQQGGSVAGAFMRIDDEGSDGDLFGRVNGPGVVTERGTAAPEADNL